MKKKGSAVQSLLVADLRLHVSDSVGGRNIQREGLAFVCADGDRTSPRSAEVSRQGRLTYAAEVHASILVDVATVSLEVGIWPPVRWSETPMSTTSAPTGAVHASQRCRTSSDPRAVPVGALGIEQGRKVRTAEQAARAAARDAASQNRKWQPDSGLVEGASRGGLSDRRWLGGG